MPEVQAKKVPVGGVFIYPGHPLPVKRVQPKNFNFVQEPVLGCTTREFVYAADDEGNLFFLHPDNSVEVPSQRRLVTQESDNHYLIVASFERQLSDDAQVLRDNFKARRITVDPDKDFALAAQQQLALELKNACDEGLAGLFQCHYTVENRALDTGAMGWVSQPARSKTSKQQGK